MTDVNWTQIAVEAVLLLGGFIIMYWKQRVEAEHRFTKLEILVEGLAEDHKKLENHITSIKKSIHELHGRVSRRVKDKSK